MPVTRAGFTLVEVIVAIVLFSIVILGISGLQLTESGLSTRESVRVRAIAALAARTESWQATPFASLPSAASTGRCALDTVSAPGGLRFFSCDTVIAATSDQRTIAVNVLAPINQRPGAVTAIPADSVARARQFVLLNARLLRSGAPESLF